MVESAENAPKVFKFPLPIDPLRLFYGIRRRWFWFIIFPLVFGSSGWIIGSSKAENRYSVSLQLIKSSVPSTIQTSEAGQAFKPRELSDDTLLATTYSTEVMSRTGIRLDIKRTPGEVKAMVEIAKQRNTSLFYLTAHSVVSAEDAINTVTVWAEEVIRFTNNLQREEARQMEAFISEQLDSIDGQLGKINQQILDFARNNNFVDVDTQTESTLNAIENIRSQLSNTRIMYETKELQINRYRQELRAQSPYEADLKKKREELTYLRGRYTDENPLVKEKLYEIDHITQQLKTISEGDIDDLKDFTGSDLGNNLYLEIIALQNEKIQLGQLLSELRKRLQIAEAQVADLPEKSLRLSELKSRRDLLIDAQALLDSRRKEASFYQTKAPGYWQVFQKPSLNDVTHSSQNVKALMLGFLGGVSGVLLALIVAVTWEFMQPGLRTPLEVAIVTKAFPLMCYFTKDSVKRSWWNKAFYPRSEGADNDRYLRSFWLTHAMSSEGSVIKSLLFVSTEVDRNEPVYWNALLNLIDEEGYKVDFGLIGECPDDLHVMIEEHSCIESFCTSLGELTFSDNVITIVRLGRIPTMNDVFYLKKFDTYFLLNSPSIATRHESHHRSDLLFNVMGPSQGLLLLDKSTGKTVPRLLTDLEMGILRKIANKETKAD